MALYPLLKNAPMLFHSLCSELHKHSQFFLSATFLFPPYSVGKKCPRKKHSHCCSNSLRSDNLTAKHSAKIAHIQLSRKDNEITWTALKSRKMDI